MLSMLCCCESMLERGSDDLMQKKCTSDAIAVAVAVAIAVAVEGRCNGDKKPTTMSWGARSRWRYSLLRFTLLVTVDTCVGLLV